MTTASTDQHAKRKVWLTFDDGPHATNTARILRTLQVLGIKATFFVVGRNASQMPSLLKEAFAAGHQIGNHTFTHPDLTKLGVQQIRNEITRTGDLIAEFTGKEKVFRPPYGFHNEIVDRAASELGYRSVLWNVDPQDWNRAYQPDGWVQHGLDQVKARQDATVVLHDTQPTTADYLERFIEGINQLGESTFTPQ